jgi:DNA primase
MKTDLNELLSHINFEEVLNHYNVKGNISGNQFVGLCPIHDDTKNSFGMNLDTGVWHCFTCGEKGTIYTFVQKLEGFPKFGQAVGYIKRMVGFKDDFNSTLDYTQKVIELFNQPAKTSKVEKAEIEEIMLPLEFKSAMKHLSIASKRVTAQMIRKFDIRYATEGFYEGHLIIPIYFNHEIVAFFARDLLGKAEKSKKYNKGAQIGQLFFNWDNAILNKKYVILTEGMLDCLKVDSFGYNVMALLGIELSLEKKMKLINNFERVYIALDNDHKEKDGVIKNPGQEGAMKLIKKIRSEVETYNILLPLGKDPDECIQEEFDLAFQNAKKC